MMPPACGYCTTLSTGSRLGRPADFPPPHAGGMAPTITAGDNTPQTPQPALIVMANSPPALLAEPPARITLSDLARARLVQAAVDALLGISL